MNIFESLKGIKDSWAQGKPILLYDDDNREGEIDMIMPSEHVSPQIVAQMRNDAGGLICCAIPDELCRVLELPFMDIIYKRISSLFPTIRRMNNHQLPYGAKSSFSVSINHTKSFTGITDIDRSLTISEVGRITRLFQSEPVSKIDLMDLWGETFRIPGHVPLLRGANGLLRSRLGHTELGLALCDLTKNSMSITVCEMLDSETNKALSIEKAISYAEDNNLIYVDGQSVIHLWSSLKKIPKREIYKRSIKND